MFQDLAKDASKGCRTLVYSLRFVTLFEHWCYVSLTPFYGNFSCFDRSLKNDLDNRGNLLLKLLENQWSDFVRAGCFTWL